MKGTHTKFRRKESISKEEMVNMKAFEKGKRNVIITDTKIRQDKIGEYKKIDKNHFYDPREKRARAYSHNRIRSEKSVKRSMGNLRDILQNYFSGEPNEIFVTLTTTTATMNVNEIKQYFTEYWKEIKKHYGNNLAYAYVLEVQQERKSLHIHCIIKDFEHKKLYIPNHINQKLWKKGQTRVTMIKDELDVNIEIDEEEAMLQPNSIYAKQKVYAIDKVISYMIKYRTKETIPSYARLYETSANLKKPKKIKIKYEEAKNLLLTNEYKYKTGITFSIVDDESKRDRNKITKEIWNKREE